MLDVNKGLIESNEEIRTLWRVINPRLATRSSKYCNTPFISERSLGNSNSIFRASEE